MIKFTVSEECFVEYKDLFNIVEKDDSVIGGLLRREKKPFESFNIGKKEISLKDTFIIRVNTNGVGSVSFALPYENLPKYEIIDKIKDFKKGDEYVELNEKDKYVKIIEMLKEYKPYFIIYNVRNGVYSKEDIQKLAKDQGLDSVVSFFNEEEEQPVQEVKNEKSVKEEKEPTGWFAKDMKNIKKNKYHFIFLTVSAFLFGFAFSVGFCNAMIGKMISILFFVCAGVGLFLDTYVYVDYFKEKSIKNRLFVYSLIFNTIGMLIALATTLIFYSVDNSEIKTAVSMKLIVGVAIGGTLASVALSVGIGYLIVLLEKKLKKPKPEVKKEEEKSEE